MSGQIEFWLDKWGKWADDWKPVSLFFFCLQSSNDGDRLLEDLQHSLTRPTGFDCVMRVRASTGLRPTGFYGAFFMSNTTDIELGNIDCDKAIAVEIRHDDKLRDDETAFFQVCITCIDLRGLILLSEIKLLSTQNSQIYPLKTKWCL